MKIVKELPKSILHSIYLIFAPLSFLNNTSKKKIPVIISLTSIPSRLKTLHIVIKSLFNQSHRPTKILLWLNVDLRDKIPKSLKKLESNLFEIKFSNLTCSHRKLIHTLKENPQATIITCDDDLIYRKKWLYNIFQEHLKYPNSIISNGASRIKMDDKGNYLPYKTWKIKTENSKLINNLIPIGAEGILYPPNSLSNEVFNENLFLKLTPKADDLWFKTMSLINGTISRRSQNRPKSPIPIWGTQKIALKNDNVKNNKNDTQWVAVSEYFNLKELLKN